MYGFCPPLSRRERPTEEVPVPQRPRQDEDDSGPFEDAFGRREAGGLYRDAGGEGRDDDERGAIGTPRPPPDVRRVELQRHPDDGQAEESQEGEASMGRDQCRAGDGGHEVKADGDGRHPADGARGHAVEGDPATVRSPQEGGDHDGVADDRDRLEDPPTAKGVPAGRNAARRAGAIAPVGRTV